MEASARLQAHAIDRLWETLPPLWGMIRRHIRAEATGRFDITIEQFQILRLVRRGLCTVSEVAAARNISRPAVSQGAEVLVRKGLLTRSENAADRRYVELGLTPAGNDLLQAVFDESRRWLKGKMGVLSAAETQTVAEAMQVLGKLLR